MVTVRVAAALLLGLSTATAQVDAQTREPDSRPGADAADAFRFVLPPMTPWRWNEDYSSLRDADELSLLELLKFFPVTKSGDVSLSTGIEVRSTYESIDNDGWGADAEPDHDYLWVRAMPHVELRWGDRFRGFVQGLSAHEIGDEAERRTIDENRADLLQAFIDYEVPLGEGLIRLRAGRQMFSLGSSRLFDPRYGPNVPLAFDTVGLQFRNSLWTVDALAGRPVENDLGAFDDSSSDDEQFALLYATRRLEAWGKRGGLDAYAIAFENEDARFDQGSGTEERYTLGTRLFGDRDGWTWNYEAFAQFGRFGRGEIRAWSVATDTTYELGSLHLKPRLRLRANLISGDDNPTDRDLETFNPLYPKGRYFGQAAVIGPFNLVNLHPAIQFELHEHWSVELSSNFLWRESDADGIYDNGGNLLRSDLGSDRSFIGSQYDVTLTYEPHRSFDVVAGYLIFEAGDFIDETGPGDTLHYVTIEARFRF